MNLLGEFFSLIPDRPYVAAHKGHTFVVDRESAKGYPLVQPNHPYVQRFIALDLDKPNSVLSYEDVGLQPSMAIENPSNGHCHYLWQLEKPIWLRPDDTPNKTTAFFSALKKGLVRTYKADPSYSGNLIKNPIHPVWRTHVFREVPYSLQEIAKYVDLSIKDVPREVADSRNCELFETVRKWAYKNRRHFDNFERWDSTIHHVALEMNHFHGRKPLPPSEVGCIARSVSKWVWNRYSGHGVTHLTKNPGIMQFETDTPIQERYRLGQQYSATVKRETTARQIEEAIRLLEEKGIIPTWRDLSRLSGKSMRTIAHYMKDRH